MSTTKGLSAGVWWVPCVVKGVDQGGLGGRSSAWRMSGASSKEHTTPHVSPSGAPPRRPRVGAASERWGNKVQVEGLAKCPALGSLPWLSRRTPPSLRCTRGARHIRMAGLRPLGVTYPHVCVHVDETADPDRRAASSDTYTGIGHRTPLIVISPVYCGPRS